MVYNFKSNIVFPNVPENKNRNMIYKVYIDSILKTAVKPWMVKS